MTFVTVTDKFGAAAPRGSRWIFWKTETVFVEPEDTLIPMEKEMVNVYQCLYGGYRIATLTEESLLAHPELFKQTR